jgi:hypothetical protein
VRAHRRCARRGVKAAIRTSFRAGDRTGGLFGSPFPPDTDCAHHYRDDDKFNRIDTVHDIPAVRRVYAGRLSASGYEARNLS